MIPPGWRDGVAVAGLGSSGVAVSRLLLARGVTVYASDVAATESVCRAADALRSAGATVDVGGHDLDRVRSSRALILSPGVPPTAPVVVAAREAGLPVLAEVDVACRDITGARYIGITGTNGKTTTTSLIRHLLQTAGVDAVEAGNIGRPLSDVALEDHVPAWLVVEVSSFQLHDAPSFTPDIGVLTNLAPNHLDRYASLEEYYADKALLFRHHHPEATWVLNGDDDAVRAMTSPIEGHKRYFGFAATAAASYDRGDGWLRLHGRPLISRKDFSLLGEHNVANALAAALAADAAGASAEAIGTGLASFEALPHRLEPVAVVGGVAWINDSKATNVGATVVAIRSMTQPFVLLLGGRHKGQPYTAIGDALGPMCRAVLAYGEAAPIIESDLPDVERVASLEDAVDRARTIAPGGAAVLLSPACSSFDAFENYVARGERFRTLVREL